MSRLTMGLKDNKFTCELTVSYITVFDIFTYIRQRE